MPSAAEARAELKLLRESSCDHMPVSRMKKADVMGALERMRMITETSPAPALMRKKTPAMVAESESDVDEPKTVVRKAVPTKAAKKDAAPVKEKASKMTMSERMAILREKKGKKE